MTAFAVIVTGRYMPQFMLKTLDVIPVEAGIGMLPMMATFATVSFVAGDAAIVPGLAIVGLGIGLFYPTATTAGRPRTGRRRLAVGGFLISLFFDRRPPSPARAVDGGSLAPRSRALAGRLQGAGRVGGSRAAHSAPR